MNHIFLLLWLSDVADSANDLYHIFLVLSLVCFVAYLISFILETADAVKNHKVSDRLRFWAILFWIAAIPFFFMPSKHTLQIMAVSQSVQVAATTDLGAEAVKALHHLLDKINAQ